MTTETTNGIKIMPKVIGIIGASIKLVATSIIAMVELLALFRIELKRFFLYTSKMELVKGANPAKTLENSIKQIAKLKSVINS